MGNFIRPPENQVSKARECYQKSLAIKPDFFFAIYLGLSYKASGKQKLAIQYYEKALELKPNHQESLVSLGNLYNHQRQFDESIKISLQVLSQNNQSIHGYYNLANAYFGRKEFEKAKVSYEQILKVSQNIPGSL